VQFLRCLTLCAWSSFLFGWHVHEKVFLLSISLPFCWTGYFYLKSGKFLFAKFWTSTFPTKFADKNVFLMFWTTRSLLLGCAADHRPPHHPLCRLQEGSQVGAEMSDQHMVLFSAQYSTSVPGVLFPDRTTNFLHLLFYCCCWIRTKK
jgi:hypothetical protein